jgi:hypothetical protein
VEITTSLKKILIERYSVPASHPEMKNILGNLNKEHPEDAIIQKYEEKVKHAPVRADIRSSASVESSIQGDVEENSLLDSD